MGGKKQRKSIRDRWVDSQAKWKVPLQWRDKRQTPEGPEPTRTRSADDRSAAPPTGPGMYGASPTSGPVPERNRVWLLRVGYDGIVYGDPVQFQPGSTALEHIHDERWREV